MRQAGADVVHRLIVAVLRSDENSVHSQLHVLLCMLQLVNDLLLRHRHLAIAHEQYITVIPNLLVQALQRKVQRLNQISPAVERMRNKVKQWWQRRELKLLHLIWSAERVKHARPILRLCLSQRFYSYRLRNFLSRALHTPRRVQAQQQWAALRRRSHFSTSSRHGAIFHPTAAFIAKKSPLDMPGFVQQLWTA